MLGFDPSVAPYDSWVHYVAAAGDRASSPTLNYVGVRWGSLVQNVTTVAKYFGLLFIIIAAIAIGLPKTGGHFTPVAPPGSFSIAPFGLALVSVLWAYDGWADLAFISGEVKDPRAQPSARADLRHARRDRDLPARQRRVPRRDVGRRDPALEARRRGRRAAAVGPAGVTFVAITVMLSTLGTLNGSILTNPRVFFAMAADGLLFRKIAAVHPRYQTPYVAIALDGGARHHLRAAANVRAARRHVRHGDPAVLRARRRVDLRVPEARRASTRRRSARRCIRSRRSCSCSRRCICSSTR